MCRVKKQPIIMANSKKALIYTLNIELTQNIL